MRQRKSQEKQEKIREKRKFEQSEKKRDNIHYRILIGLMIFWVGYYCLIEPHTIGEDRRHSIYIFWLPTLAGIVVLGIYRWQFLIYRFKENKEFIVRLFLVCFYLLQGMLFSFLSFGQVAKMGWDYANYRVVKQNPVESLRCEMIEVWDTKRSNYLSFRLHGQYESIHVDSRIVTEYEDKNPKDYEVIINARKGIWNHYWVENFKIVHK